MMRVAPQLHGNAARADRLTSNLHGVRFQDAAPIRKLAAVWTRSLEALLCDVMCCAALRCAAVQCDKGGGDRQLAWWCHLRGGCGARHRIRAVSTCAKGAEETATKKNQTEGGKNGNGHAYFLRPILSAISLSSPFFLPLSQEFVLFADMVDGG